MKPDEKKTEEILARMARPDNRSPLFWWLFENHDRIVESRIGLRMSWKQWCSEFSAAGIWNVHREPVVIGTARKTWWRVRRLVAATRKREEEERVTRVAAAQARRMQPSRMSKDLGPQLAVESSLEMRGPVVRTRWNSRFECDEDGFIIVVGSSDPNTASAALAKQKMNVGSSHHRDEGIEKMVGAKEE